MWSLSSEAASCVHTLTSAFGVVNQGISLSKTKRVTHLHREAHARKYLRDVGNGAVAGVREEEFLRDLTLRRSVLAAMAEWDPWTPTRGHCHHCTLQIRSTSNCLSLTKNAASNFRYRGSTRCNRDKHTRGKRHVKAQRLTRMRASFTGECIA